jgi:hypothetical protein
MQYRFLIDTNLPIDTEDEEVSSILREYDVAVEGSTDLPAIGRKVAAREPDVAFIPPPTTIARSARGIGTIGSCDPDFQVHRGNGFAERTGGAQGRSREKP